MFVIFAAYFAVHLCSNKLRATYEPIKFAFHENSLGVKQMYDCVINVTLLRMITETLFYTAIDSTLMPKLSVTKRAYLDASEAVNEQAVTNPFPEMK